VSRQSEELKHHREATDLAHNSFCLLCGREGMCVPAHFPVHRGMGGRWGYWGPSKWVPLCGEPGGCHDLVDGRLGIGSQKGWERWRQARKDVSSRLLLWWDRSGSA
jgi:hypothetical protein